MPVECEHGRVVDWGDFGGEDAKPELCYHCRERAQASELREFVFKHFVSWGRANPAVREIGNQINVFTLFDFCDFVADALTAALKADIPLAQVEPEGSE